MDMTVQSGYGTSTQSIGSLATAQKNAIRKAYKKSKKTTKKKSVNYNAKEISRQLSHASRAAGVSQVLIRARGMVEYLQRCAMSGQYDESEVKAALAHAKRMVKCAKKKMRNMQNEEKLEKKGRKSSVSGNIKRNNEVRELVRRELKKLRQKNRGEEQGEISDADMKYLKEKIRQQQRSMAAREYASGEQENASEVSAEAGDVMAEGADCMEVAASVDVVL